jgi:hypothetical protein
MHEYVNIIYDVVTTKDNLEGVQDGGQFVISNLYI